MKRTTLLAPALGVVTAYMTMVPVRYTFAQGPTPTRGQWRAEMRKELKQEKESYKLETKSIRDKYKKVLVDGTISGINGANITITKDSKSYTINTDANTRYVRKFGGKAQLADLSTGDTVSVRGTFSDEAKTTVLATLVKDTSIQKRWATLTGSVKSKADGSLVITTEKKGDQTILVGTETKLLNKAGVAVTLDQILVGHKVIVSGVWNSNLNKLISTNKIRDLSL